jgi:hypothetical protein
MDKEILQSQKKEKENTKLNHPLITVDTVFNSSNEEADDESNN